MNKKKLIIGGTAAGVILVAAIFGFVFLKGHSSGSSDSGDLVYVDSVTSIMGLGSGTGQLNRFAGVVEPQKTVTIKQSSDKKVKECYVKEGDEVKKGQKLFIYDTSEAEENLSSKEIEMTVLRWISKLTNQMLQHFRKKKQMRPAKISWIILCVSSLPRTTRKRANTS